MTTHDDYAGIHGVNFSTLKHFARSPADYKSAMAAHDDTPAMALGRLVHMRVFEPHTCADRLALWSGGRRAGAEWFEFQHDHVRKEIVRVQDFDAAEAIAAAVRAHPTASIYLSAPGECEVVRQWTDPGTGLACKGRVDKIVGDTLIELKTCRGCGPRQMSAAMHALSYHAQLAWYLDGFGLDDCRVIAVEKVPPKSCRSPKVRVYRVRPAAIDSGRDLYRIWMDRLVQCRATNQWPAWLPADLEEDWLDLPPYAYDADDTWEMEDADG